MTRRGWRRLGVGLGLALALWLLAVAGNTVGRYFGWIVRPQSPQSLAETLAPFYRVNLPAGEGPFPTGLLYSGCDGPRDNLDRWAAMLNAEGWAAVIVDSHGPRDYLDTDIWRLICAGQLLMGSERAGDVLVSLYDARRMDFVDPDRLALIGSSHGGWAIMELLAFAAAWRLPFNLAGLPEGASEHPLAGVLGSILVYPYCGPANRAYRTGWTYPAPVLFLLSDEDLIAPEDDCVEVAAMLEAQGVPVETVVFEGVTHGFDQEARQPFSPFRFDAETTERALGIGSAFVSRVANSVAPSASGPLRSD